jgi:hypothetical protein
MAKAAILLVTLLVTGCAGPKIVVDGIEVYEKTWHRVISELRPRASFELTCSADQLTFNLLRRRGRHPTEVAISGCEKHGLYVRPTIQFGMRYTLGSWMLSSVSSSVATQ